MLDPVSESAALPDVSSGDGGEVSGDDFVVTSTGGQEAPASVPSESASPDEGKDPDDEQERVRKAAETLGKKGGESSAIKRAGEEAKRRVDEEIQKARPDQRKQLASDRVREAAQEAAQAKRERDALKAERDRIAAELEQYRTRPTPPAREERPQPPRPPQQAAPGRPELKDFETHEEWVEATADWKAETKIQAYRQEMAQARRAEAMHRDIQRGAEGIARSWSEAEKSDPTFRERAFPLASSLQPSFTLARGERPGPLNVLADEIFKAEKSAALLAHFADHPEDVERIKTLPSPADVQVEVRYIARGLGAAPLGNSAPGPEVSQAKPPVRPVSGMPRTADVVPDDDVDFDAHVSYYNAKEARR